MKKIKGLFSYENKYGYLAKNSMLFAISSFGSKLLVFFLIPLYTKILSTSDYGIADLVLTTSNLLAYIVTINISDAVLRFMLDKRADKDGIFRFGFVTIIKGCTFFSAVVFILYLFNIIEWPDYCYLFLVLYLSVNAFNTLFQNYLRGIDKIKQVAVSGVLTTLVTIISNIVFLIAFKFGIIGYLLSLVLGTFFSTIYCLTQCKGVRRLIIGELCEDEIKGEMVKYSLPLIFNGIAWWVNGSLDKYFIVAINGVSVNGIYSVSSKIPTIFTTMTGIFSQAWSLSAVKEFGQEGGTTFFENIYKLYHALLLIICSILILINIPIAKLLFAKDFFVAWKYSSPLLLSVFFNSLASFVGSIFAVVKDNRMYAVSTVSAAVVNTAMNAILIPKYGALGAATATAMSFFVVFVIRFMASKKYIVWSTSAIKDISLYFVLGLQVVFEHMDSHVYIGQVVCFLAIIFLLRKEIFKFAKNIKSIKKKLLHK